MNTNQQNIGMTTKELTRGLLAGALVVVAGLGLAGCRGERTDARPRQFLPDMDDSPKWKPQAESQFFADGRTMRPRVGQTVAFGVSADAADPDRAKYLKADDRFFKGSDGVLPNGEPRFLDAIPIGSIPNWPSDANLREDAFRSFVNHGRERFDIYCSACHGYKGDGKGEVGVRWSAAVANFHDPKFKDPKERTGKDGYIFYAARYGVWDRNGQRVLDGNYHITETESGPADKQLMPPYAHAVDEYDAWSIVAYIRVLQATRTTNYNEVPAQELDRLRASPPPPPPKEPEPAAPAATPPNPAAPATPTPAGGDSSGGTK